MCHKLGAKVMGKKSVCQVLVFFDLKNEVVLTLKCEFFGQQKRLKKHPNTEGVFFEPKILILNVLHAFF
jgi:hypothetical protein